MSNDVNKLKQRLEIRKYLVFAGMFLLFLGAKRKKRKRKKRRD